MLLPVGRSAVVFAAYLRQLLATALALALALPCAAASGAKNPGYKTPGGSQLEGQVTGPDGKPSRGAVVAVRSLDGNGSWQSLPSDSKGRFRVQAVPYGWVDVIVTTPTGQFLGDQALNLPPGTKVVANFSLLETSDKPASWWTDRRVERPAGLGAGDVAGMAQSSQRLTGVEYWKSPGGIAIIASVAVVSLGLIAAGGGKYKAP